MTSLLCVVALLTPPSVVAEFSVAAPNARQVQLVGDFAGWDQPIPMIEARPGTFTKTLRLPARARLEYKFVVDNAWILDPTAPTSPNGLGGENSVWSGPVYRPSALTSPPADPLRVHRWTQDGYAISLFNPARETPTHLLLYHDGRDFETLARLPEQVANLRSQRAIPPIALVLITSPDRRRDYWQNPQPYLQFLRTLLIPRLQREIGPIPPQRTFMGGASLGGLITLRAGAELSDLIAGGLIVHSASLWINDAQEWIKPAAPRARLALGWGTWESGPDHDRLHRALGAAWRASGRPAFLKSEPQAHTYSLWREDFGPLLRGVLSPGASGPDALDQTARLTLPQ